MYSVYFVRQEQPGGRGRPSLSAQIVNDGVYSSWQDYVRGDGCSYSGIWHEPLHGFDTRQAAEVVRDAVRRRYAEETP